MAVLAYLSSNVPDSRRPPALDSSYLRRGDVVPEPSPDFPHLAPLRESIVIGGGPFLHITDYALDAMYKVNSVVYKDPR